MGKKNKKFTISKYQENDSEEENNIDEDLPSGSDLEFQDYDDNANDEENEEDEVEKNEEIILVDELNAHSEKIKKEFGSLMAKRGGNANDWLETLVITNAATIDKNLNIDDDIKRELSFYNMTNENVVKGILKLKEVK